MHYAVALFAGLVFVLVFAAYRRWERESKMGSETSQREEQKGDEQQQAQKKGKKHWLVGKAGSVRGKVYHVGQRTVTIGRKPTNFIQLTDQKVSRIHCQLQWTPAGIQVSDLDSTVGTEVDGDKISASRDKILEDGGMISIGDAEFIYHRKGDFETNYEFIEQKARGEKFESVTAVNDSDEWKRAILAELERADGDPDLAADNIGIERQAFQQLMEEQGIEDSDRDAIEKAT